MGLFSNPIVAVREWICRSESQEETPAKRRGFHPLRPRATDRHLAAVRNERQKLFYKYTPANAQKSAPCFAPHRFRQIFQPRTARPPQTLPCQRLPAGDCMLRIQIPKKPSEFSHTPPARYSPRISKFPPPRPISVRSAEPPALPHIGMLSPDNRPNIR